MGTLAILMHRLLIFITLKEMPVVTQIINLQELQQIRLKSLLITGISR